VIEVRAENLIHEGQNLQPSTVLHIDRLERIEQVISVRRLSRFNQKFLAGIALAPVAFGIGVMLEASESGLNYTKLAYADCYWTTDDRGNSIRICNSSPTPTQPPQPAPSPRPSPFPTPKPVPTTIPDSDGDGLRDNVDNCDNVANPDQANFDGDVDGNVCDPDIDNDLLPNDKDANNFSTDNDQDGLFDGYDPDQNSPDVDGDGFLDGDPTEIEDKSADGVQDLFQSRIDIDDDGFSAETGDTDEANPCVPSLEADTCDQDNDGLTNEKEAEIGTDPKIVDTDSDGVNDKKDKEPLSKAGVNVDAFGVEIPVTTEASTDTTLERTEEVTSTTETDATTTTTDIETITENSDEDEDSNILWWSMGGAGAAGLGLLAGFVVVKNKRKEDEEVGFTGTDASPVAGN
jgi:hypothetical protein